jgi:hypothetical protein
MIDRELDNGSVNVSHGCRSKGIRGYQTTASENSNERCDREHRVTAAARYVRYVKAIQPLRNCRRFGLETVM